VLASAASAVLGLTTRAAGDAARTAAVALAGPSNTASEPSANDRHADTGVRYVAERLLRPVATPEGRPVDSNATTTTTARDEAITILSLALLRGTDVPAPDRAELATIVSRSTGLGRAESEQRVTQVLTDAKARAAEYEAALRKVADDARRGSAKLALWMFVALLAGAFAAAWSATLGGRQRDLP
jgi:hypothetical protein